MRTVSVPVTIVPGSAGDIFEQVTTTGIPVYPLSWRLPCCRSCIQHQGDPGGIPVTAVFYEAHLHGAWPARVRPVGPAARAVHLPERLVRGRVPRHEPTMRLGENGTLG